MPDEFHDLQPQLLSRTLRLSDHTRGNWFTASDLNLYYNGLAQTPTKPPAKLEVYERYLRVPHTDLNRERCK